MSRDRYPFPLSRFLHGAGIASLAFLVSFGACNRKPDVKPAEQEPRDTVAAVATPKILELTIPGVPKDSIRIDQAKKTITVALPDTLPFSRFQPEFKLSDNVFQVVHGSAADGTGMVLFPGTPAPIGVEQLLGCPDSCNRFTVTTAAGTGGSLITSYQVLLKTPGKLIVQTPADPVEFFTFETPSVTLSLKNLAGSPLITAYVLRLQGGTDTLGRSVNLRKQYDQARPNQLTLPLDKNLAPGAYDLELLLADGQRIRATKPILFEGPTLRLGPTCTGSALLKGSGRIGLEIGGITNGDNSVFRLTDAAGRVYELKADRYRPQKTGLSARVGAEVEPGNYTVQLLRNGQAQENLYALSVLRYRGQPYINTISCSTGPAQPTAALELKREPTAYALGVPYFVFSWENELAKEYPHSSEARLKLVSISQPGHVETVKAILPQQPEVSPSFKLPASVKPGDYYLTFQISYEGGKVLESEPYQRKISVK